MSAVSAQLREAAARRAQPAKVSPFSAGWRWWLIGVIQRTLDGLERATGAAASRGARTAFYSHLLAFAACRLAEASRVEVAASALRRLARELERDGPADVRAEVERRAEEAARDGELIAAGVLPRRKRRGARD